MYYRAVITPEFNLQQFAAFSYLKFIRLRCMQLLVKDESHVVME
jgi:hypothetical protein